MQRNIHPPSKRRSLAYMLLITGIAVGVAITVWWAAQQTITETVPSGPQLIDTTHAEKSPTITGEVILIDRQHIWEIAFLPDTTLLFTERNGTLNYLQGEQAKRIAQINDVYARGEGGLMGMAIDPDFAENRFIYTCFNSTQGGPDVRVVRWRLSHDMLLQDRQDIITGIPSQQNGRHSGCRLAFGPDEYLWTTTGDAAIGTTPQDPKSLGGKILRTTRDGAAAPDNPASFTDSRIYSYGHRNTQGIAFFSEPRNDILGVSVQHGPSVDDQINPLLPGNFGWDPMPGYNESVPMTDSRKFPDANQALWNSGRPPLAPAGAAIINGSQWKIWDGALAVAMLRSEHLRLFTFSNTLQVTSETPLLDTFGRLRAVTQGPDGALYVGTSNGNNDKIIRVEPLLR